MFTTLIDKRKIIFKYKSITVSIGNKKSEKLALMRDGTLERKSQLNL